MSQGWAGINTGSRRSVVRLPAEDKYEREEPQGQSYKGGL